MKQTDFINLSNKFPGVTINEYVSIIKPEVIRIGEGTRIDNFVRLEGGEGLDVGKFCHFASSSGITGGGSCKIGDFTGIAQGVRLVTGTGFPFIDKFKIKIKDETHPYYKNKKGEIVIGSYVLIGVNAVILPNVVIADGAIVAAGSVVLDNVPSWTMVAGNPARIMKTYY